MFALRKNYNNLVVKKKRLSPISRYLIVFIFGILLILISVGWYFYDQMRFSFASSANENRATKQAGYAPTYINIPKVNISLSVNETIIRNGIWEVSKVGASHLTTSSNPGNNGNVILYSHDTNDRFGPIKWLSKSDIIYLTTIDGQQHSYTVENISIVAPNNTKAIQPTNTEKLTIYTCYGFAALKRVVVTALPTSKI